MEAASAIAERPPATTEHSTVAGAERCERLAICRHASIGYGGFSKNRKNGETTHGRRDRTEHAGRAGRATAREYDEDAPAVGREHAALAREPAALDARRGGHLPGQQGQGAARVGHRD